MEHADCRAAVLDDETDRTDVRRHLRRCSDCRGFANEVARIVSVAPTLYPHGAPDGLADRVVAAVGATADSAAGAVAGAAAEVAGITPMRPSLWREVRRPLVTSTAVAAALLLVLGLLALVQTEDQPSGPERALLAAATATEDAGSAEMRVEGSVSVDVDVPDNPRAQADFRGLPAEIDAYFEARYAEIMVEFNRQMAEFNRQVEAMFDEFNRQLQEFERSLGAGRPGRPPTPPRMPRAPTRPTVPEDRRPTLPPSLKMDFGISGTGAVSFAREGALGIQGEVRTAGGNIAPASGSASAGFRLVANGDRVVLQAPDGSWRELPGAAGPLGSVVLRPGAVPRILRSAAKVERVGANHYRFEVDASEVVAVKDATLRDRYTAEVWIGPDKRVERLAVSSRGTVEDQRWDTRLTVELGGYGKAAVGAVVPPVAGRAEVRGEADLVVYPFGPTIGATLRR